MSFKEITVQELNINPITLFSKDWPLLAAGNEQNGCNAMTIGWGHIGAIWNVPSGFGGIPTAEVYVRPERYTKEFMDREELFTISVLPESFRKILGYMGSRSGRDENKIENAGLTPVYSDGTVYFEEAELVLICRKIYQSDITEAGFIDKSILERCYPEKSFHTAYMGEIIKVLTK